MLPEIYKNSEKMGGFMHFLANKSPKTLFFDQNYFTRYNPEIFFEEYINFKFFHYLSHCGVICTCSKFWKPYSRPNHPD